MSIPECTEPGCPNRCPDHAFLCTDHTKRLRADLARLPQLADDLPDTITRLSRIALQGSGSDTLLPWNEEAAVAGRKVHATMTAIANAIARRRPITRTIGPVCERCTHQTCRQHREYLDRMATQLQLSRAVATRQTGVLARWLAEQVGWIRRQTDAHHFADAIGGSVQLLEQVIEKATARVFPVGECCKPNDDGTPCTGQLYAVVRNTDDLFPSELTCEYCGFQLTAREWSRWARMTGRLKRNRTRAGKVVA